MAIELEAPGLRAHAKLIAVWVEYFEAILLRLQERNAMRRIFVRTVGTGLGFADHPGISDLMFLANFDVKISNCHPFFAARRNLQFVRPSGLQLNGDAADSSVRILQLIECRFG
jgi:hypothetical protein